MDKRQQLGYGGAALLLIGFFAPLFSISLMGFSKTIGFVDFIGQGSWAAILVLVAVIAAGVLSYLKQYRLLLVPAGLVVAMLVYMVINIGASIGDALGNGATIDSSMASAIAKMIQPSFGWLFLVLGPVALALGALLKPATPAEPAA